MNLLILHHPDIARHDSDSAVGTLAAGRIEAVTAGVLAVKGVREVLAKVPVREALLRFHTERYLDDLDALDASLAEGDMVEMDADTHMNSHTLRAALLSVGAGVQAVEAVAAGKAKVVFCPVLAGHHAGAGHGEGFCVLNAVAVAAHHAHALGLRVAVLDFDTHSGNGTIAAVDGVAGMILAETYQEGYPIDVDSHGPNVLRTLVDSPISWRAAWDDFMPQVRAFGPDIVLLSAGFDAHKADPLGRVKLDDDDFTWLFDRIAALGKPTVALLEGGYDVPTTVRMAVRLVEVLGEGGLGRCVGS